MTQLGDVSRSRQAYDDVATLYAERFGDVLANPPVDRGLLAAFAELVRAADAGPVADLGCGPGHLTAYLHSLGLDAFGIDLSAAMIAIAREAQPHLRFDEGSMADLDLPDASLGGIVAWYSLIHMPPADLPAVLSGFHRVLAPGGWLLVGFQATDEAAGEPCAFDHKVTTAYRWPPDALAGLLVATGFTETARLVRVPEEAERFPHARLLVAKVE